MINGRICRKGEGGSGGGEGNRIRERYDKGDVREGKAPWREGEWVITVGFSQCLYKYFEGCCTNKRGTTES